VLRRHRGRTRPAAVSDPPPGLGLGRHAADRLDRDSPTPIKRTHLETHPYASLTYWAPDHDTCIEVWERFASAPEPVGYDPAMIPGWTSPTAASFVAMRLTPWRLRVMPGEVMTQARADLLLTWRA
jgi:hypothetical protein